MFLDFDKEFAARRSEKPRAKLFQPVLYVGEAQLILLTVYVKVDAEHNYHTGPHISVGERYNVSQLISRLCEDLLLTVW